MRRVFPLLIALLAIAAALPAVASAQDNSAIDEYIEQVPEGGGEQPSDEQGGGGGTSGGRGDESTPLPPGTLEALESDGASGAAAAALAEATAPTGSRERGGSDGTSSRDPEGGLPPVGDVVGGIAGGSESGGLGPALPIILGVALLAALALVAARRFRGPEDASQA